MYASQPAAVDLNATLGALEIGAFTAVLLFGFSTVQMYMYMDNYRSDQTSIKGLVSRMRITIRKCPAESGRCSTGFECVVSYESLEDLFLLSCYIC
jgi:hypothetical protein